MQTVTMACYRLMKRRGRTSVILVLIIGACLLVKITVEPFLDYHSELKSLPTHMLNSRTTRMYTWTYKQTGLSSKREHTSYLEPLAELSTNGTQTKERNITTIKRQTNDAQVLKDNANAEHNIAEIIHAEGEAAALATPKGKQPKVLILAYFRSGSTLTGSFFNHHPDTFYSFEPLHPLHKSMNTRSKLLYLDGRIRSAPQEKDLPELTFEILQAFFSCNFHALDYSSLIRGFLKQSFSYVEFAACLRAGRGVHNFDQIREKCIVPLVRKCQSSAAVVVKSIRTRMPVADKLLNLFPDLKIIHLQRDPRGMACSLHSGSCLAGLRDMEGRCSFMSIDIGHKRKMAEELKNRVLNIQYESIARTPLITVQEMFSFANISLHKNVMLWTYTTLLSGTNVNGSMSLHKADPIATSYRWTTRINWRVVVKCREICHDAIEENNYPRFSNIQEVRNFKLPITNRTEQKSQLENLLKRNASGSAG